MAVVLSGVAVVFDHRALSFSGAVTISCKKNSEIIPRQLSIEPIFCALYLRVSNSTPSTSVRTTTGDGKQRFGKFPLTR